MSLRVFRTAAVAVTLVSSLALWGCASQPADDGLNQAAPKTPAVWFGTALHTEEFPPSLSTNGASSGARVEYMPADSPARAAGVREGDIVVRFDGTASPGTEELTRLIAAVPAPRTVQVDVLREGRIVTLSVPLAARPADLAQRFQAGVADRIAAEQQQAEEKEKGGALNEAFVDYVRSARLLIDEKRSYRVDTDQALDNDILHMRALLGELQKRPAIPSEADRHNQRAIAVLRNATGDADNVRAAAEFADAIYEAPWVPDLYVNLGLVLDKTGDVEEAIHSFRRYLLLNPAAADAARIKQKLIGLEILADERKPWLPYLSNYNGSDGGVSRISLRGRQLFISVVKPAPSADHNYKPGDTLFYGTIHGSDVDGKWVMERKDSLLVKCLGAVSQYDAKGHAGPDELVIRAYTKINFNTFTCDVTSHEWQLAGRYPATFTKKAEQ